MKKILKLLCLVTASFVILSACSDYSGRSTGENNPALSSGGDTTDTTVTTEVTTKTEPETTVKEPETTVKETTEKTTEKNETTVETTIDETTFPKQVSFGVLGVNSISIVSIETALEKSTAMVHGKIKRELPFEEKQNFDNFDAEASKQTSIFEFEVIHDYFDNFKKGEILLIMHTGNHIRQIKGYPLPAIGSEMLIFTKRSEDDKPNNYPNWRFFNYDIIYENGKMVLYSYNSFIPNLGIKNPEQPKKVNGSEYGNPVIYYRSITLDELLDYMEKNSELYVG